MIKHSDYYLLHPIFPQLAILSAPVLWLLLIILGSLKDASASVPVPSCATPAANWATLTACRTETARALTPTARVVIQTQTPVPQATPTRVLRQFFYCASLPESEQIEPGLWRIVCDYR